MKKKPLFAASLLSTNFAFMEENINKIASTATDFIHFDIMDGNFVPVITFGHKMVSDCRQLSTLTFDIHLMVSHPEILIPAFAKAGADYITIQAEATIHLHRVIMQIKELGKHPGICIVPSTPVSRINELLPFLDLVLVMTVNPGYGGQKFIPEMVEKIAQLNEIREKKQYNYSIEVDGGINIDTFQSTIDAGVDILVAGSAFINAPDPRGFVTMIKG